MNLLRKNLEYILICTLTVLFVTTGNAQYDWERNQDLQVFEEGDILDNAWTGGFTAPQFSKIDVDMDGDEDLFVFDRDGWRKMVFLNTDPAPGNISYTYAPEYADLFPDLRDWALLRDFDCDGKPDIFTSFQSSVKVYRNTSTEENGLSFELASSQLQCEFDFGGGPEFFPLLVLSIDLPSITDYDGDGDLDIVTFTESATTMYFFEGQGADNGDCGDLSFKCTNRCYGMARESAEDNALFIGDEFECPFNVLDPRDHGTRDFRHTGGSLFSIDLDDNGILDLMIGDVTFKNLSALYMEDAVDGQDSTAFVDENFPSALGSVPVDLQRFPAGFYVDIDNDGVNDLLIAPNTRIESDGHESIWYYHNSGTNSAPDFELIQTDFLQSETIEVGIGAYPVFFDYNNDGLKDLVLANKEYFEEIDLLPSQLALYENTGTASEPAFTLIDNNWVDIPSFQIESIYPSFGDLDGDGDDDMILGEETGILHYFENVADPGQPADFELSDPAITDFTNVDVIDVGQFSTPQLYDLDQDGLLDLLVGEKLGVINYFRNVGDASNFAFELQQGIAQDSLGGVAADNFLGINGYSVPCFYRNANDDTELYMGNETGTIQRYNNIDGNLDGYFEEQDYVLDGIQEGDRSAVWVEDITNDGIPELFYGILNGGLIYFEGTDPDNVISLGGFNGALEVFPNPSNGLMHIRIPKERDGGDLQITDLSGRIIASENSITRNLVRLVTDEWAAGTYLVTYQRNGIVYSAKVMVY